MISLLGHLASLLILENAWQVRVGCGGGKGVGSLGKKTAAHRARECEESGVKRVGQRETARVEDLGVRLMSGLCQAYVRLASWWSLGLELAEANRRSVVRVSRRVRLHFHSLGGRRGPVLLRSRIKYKV